MGLRVREVYKLNQIGIESVAVCACGGVGKV